MDNYDDEDYYYEDYEDYDNDDFKYQLGDLEDYEDYDNDDFKYQLGDLDNYDDEYKHKQYDFDSNASSYVYHDTNYNGYK